MSDENETPKTIRINRFFTEHGFASRREADRLIESGRVKINERVAKLGDQVGEDDKVSLDGRALRVKPKKPIMLVYHKPRGVICTMDRRVEDNLVDAVNFPERVFNVGRLDRFSEGLLLLTNMGEAVNRILRARYGHEKEYIVDYSNEVSDEAIRRMSRGLEILGRPTLPCQIDRLTSKRLRIVLTEGRNRQIRRMAEAVDLHVSRLRRVRVMHIKLGTLPAGEYRHLSAPEFEELEARLLAAEALPAPHYEIASDDDDED